MVNPGRGGWRLLRGLSLASACLTMSLTAHAAGGGAVHLSPGLVVGGLALSVICVAAAESRGSFGGILSIVVVSQVVLHLFAAAGAQHADAAPGMVGLTGAMAGHHAVAAVVVSLLLAHGDRLIWAFWSLARLPQITVLGTPVPGGERQAVTCRYKPVLLPGLELRLGGQACRAPPAAS